MLPSPPQSYPLSLHDALPIFACARAAVDVGPAEALHQRRGINWLDEVVDRAQRDPELGVVDHAHDNDWDGACRIVTLQSGDHLPAVELGHDDIERDRRRLELARALQRL